MKPFLRWCGGKTRLLPELVKRLPKDWRERTYVEPFVGSGALFFHLQPKRAALADANADLITVYRSIRDARQKTEDALATLRDHHFHHGVNPAAHYLSVRRAFNDHQASFTGCTSAAQFIYLNRTCFNGLYRVNSKGEFNVPYGQLTRPTISMDLRPYAEALRGVTLLDDPFVETLDYFGDPDAFIYADPPYDGPTHQAYTAAGFGRAEQNQLALELKRVVRVGAKVMVSNSDTPYVRALYGDWHIHEVDVRRSISANGTRPRAKELIITSYPVEV